MGKRRNRKKKTVYHRVDLQDCLTFSSGNGNHPKHGRNLPIKTETESPRHDEKARNKTAEGEVLSSPVLMASSTKTEFAQDVKSSDQKAKIYEDYQIKMAKDGFTTKTSSPPRLWEKSAPVIQSLKGEGASPEKDQQMSKLSAASDINKHKDMEKSYPQISISTNDTDSKPHVTYKYSSHGKSLNGDDRICTMQKKPSSYAILSNSSVQGQTQLANYSHCGNSCSSVKTCSEVGEIAKMTGTRNKEISGRRITERGDAENKENSARSKRFSSNSSVYDAMEKLPNGNSVYSHQFKKSSGKSEVPLNSGNKSWMPAGNPKKRFEEALSQWLPVRNQSIQKLRKLLDNALSNEAFYDNVQLNCKNGSVVCKYEKMRAVTWTWEIASSLGSMFCDIAGGLTSVAHMLSTDSIQSEFQQVMDRDAAATMKMYEARSRYVTEYHYTDEIIRKFGGTTLGETLGKISEAVGITEFFQKMKMVNDNTGDIMQAAIFALSCATDRNCNRDVGREIVDAVQELVDSNPACVGTAAGVGKSLYGAADLRLIPLKRAGKVGALVKAGTVAVDLALVQQEESDINDLERKIRSGSRSTVGNRVQEALGMLIEEKREMLELLSIM